MRLLIPIFLILFLLVTIESFAASPVQIQSLVQEFYTESIPRPLPDPPDKQPPQCVPGISPRSCIEAVCDQVSRFECDERQDLLEISRQCHNVSGTCVRSLCGRLDRLACDQLVEVFQVTEVCRGLVDVSCVDYVCSRISRFDCDDISELVEIARQCR